MRRPLLLLAGWAIVTVAHGATATDEPLDPDKAFRLSVTTTSDPAGLTLRYAIVDGYYLYRYRFALQVATPGMVLKSPAFPAGEPKDDPYFGNTEVYRRYVEIPVAYEGNARPGRYTVEVTAQGCADSGFCYAPFKQKVYVTVPPGQSAPKPPAVPG